MTTDKPQSLEPTPGPPGLGIRHMMFLVLASALVMAAVVEFWRVALFFVLTLSPVVAVVGVLVILVRRRAAHQETFLRVLTIAAERSVPISTAAEAFGQLDTGGLARDSLGLGRMLSAGEPLPRAIQRNPRILSRTAAALACVGWSEQALVTGLREAEDSESHRKLYSARIVPRLAYLIFLLFALESVGGFFLYWIMPKFRMIFADFGQELPTPTLIAIQVGDAFTRPVYLLPLVILLQLAAAIMLMVAYLGLLRVRPPGVSWLVRRLDSAAVLRSLAITVDAGRPIGEGLTLMGDHYRVGSVRRRLNRARDRIGQGHPWTFVLRDAGMVRPADLPILESAEKAGNLAWALRTVAATHERRYGQTLQAFSQVLLPLIVVGVGSVVGLFAVGYFLPLVELIRRLGL